MHQLVLLGHLRLVIGMVRIVASSIQGRGRGMNTVGPIRMRLRTGTAAPLIRRIWAGRHETVVVDLLLRWSRVQELLLRHEHLNVSVGVVGSVGKVERGLVSLMSGTAHSSQMSWRSW